MRDTTMRETSIRQTKARETTIRDTTIRETTIRESGNGRVRYGRRRYWRPRATDSGSASEHIRFLSILSDHGRRMGAASKFPFARNLPGRGCIDEQTRDE